MRNPRSRELANSLCARLSKEVGKSSNATQCAHLVAVPLKIFRRSPFGKSK
jgi:hypothetical protein